MPPRRRRGGGQKADADEAKPVAPGQRQRSASGGKGAGRATPVARGRTGGGRGGASRNGEYDSEEARRRLAQAEYDTEVHFQKCFGVMNEIYETNRSFPALPESFNFLDLGCAPGGFSSFLLDDERCGMGYGVTLPAENGGFPARISKHEKAAQYALQYADLFLIEPKDLLPTTNVYSVIADAQYLNDGLAYAEAGRYTGAKCTTKQNGIWALTLKQMWLGFERLETGGYFMVRFGWKDYGDHWSQWYKACALRLFQLLYAVFGEGAGPSPSELYKDGRGGVALDPFRADLGAVTCIKSSYYNASTSSFYVVATNFRREAYQKLEVGKLLQREIATLTGKDAGDHDILGRVVVSPEVAAKVETELENVEKLREIGEATKK